MSLKLEYNGEFVVKESKTTNIIVGCVFLILFFMAVYNLVYHPNDLLVTYQPEYHRKLVFKMMLFTVAPGIAFIIKGIMHRTVIKVNKTGIYVYGKFKTDWAYFINACITEKPVTGSYSDNFVLILQFYKWGEEGYFRSKVALRNTIDKGDEEIIQAIRFYNNVYLASNTER